MKRDLPAVIHEIGFDFNWSNNKVWALDIPIETLSIDKLVWHFDYPFIWPIPVGHTEVTPRQVLKYPEQYPEEYQRTVNADLSFPIDIMFWKNRWLILDGLHRLMKQANAGERTIKVRKVPRSAITQIRKD